MALRQFRQSFVKLFRSKSVADEEDGDKATAAKSKMHSADQATDTDGHSDVAALCLERGAEDNVSTGSSSDSGGIPELFVVTDDYVAAGVNGVSGLRLVKGQHVEVVEWPSSVEGAPTSSGNEQQQQCRVRVVLPPITPTPADSSAAAASSEGLVPMSVLRQFMSLRLSNSRTSFNDGQTAADGTPAVDSPSSATGVAPSTPGAASNAQQRKTSFKKLFSNPVRKGKDVQGKMAPGGKGEKKANKLAMLKNFLHGSSDDGAAKKDPPPLAHSEDLTSEEQKSATNSPAGAGSSSRTPSIKPVASMTVSSPAHSVITAASAATDEGADEDVAVELPPPMAEIQPLVKDTLTPDVSQSELPPEFTANKVAAGGRTVMTGESQSDDTSPQDMLPSTNIADETNSTSSPSQQTEGEDGAPVNGSTETGDDASMQHSLSQEEEDPRAKNSQKRQYVVAELIETERDYVRDLGLIVDGYLEMIKKEDVPKPAGLELREAYIVFGNIHQIYDWHRETFMPELEKALEEPERVALAFNRYERRLYMYVKYCENKPKSEFLVAEYFEYFEELRQKMGHRLQLPDLLIKPVQRIMKYQLLLKDIMKHTQRMGDDTKELEKALHVMCVVPKAANDMMSVGRLQGYAGKITSQGKLLLQDNLQVIEQSSKFKTDQSKFRERRVFLFEQVIIVSEEIDKRKNNLSNTGYIYKCEIKANKMAIDTKGTDPTVFTLIDKSHGSDLKLICQASSEEVKQNWVTQIGSMLNMQGDFMRALTSPITYQKELTKDS